jgi:hypothetical protein
VPKLRTLPFETAIIERDRRRESSVEEALVDVSRRCEYTTSRRHHRSLVGHAGEPEHDERAEPEDLRADRDLAQPADRREPTVCVPRRLVVEAELGRRSAQRIAAGGDWRE